LPCTLSVPIELPGDSVPPLIVVAGRAPVPPTRPLGPTVSRLDVAIEQFTISALRSLQRAAADRHGDEKENLVVRRLSRTRFRLPGQLPTSDGVLWAKPTAQEQAMRNAATHSSKELAHEIALLKRQLDDLSSSVADSGESILARGEAVLGTVRKAKDAVIEQAEAQPLTTLAAVAGIGFLAGLLYRRN
jgi:hypothetical protein